MLKWGAVSLALGLLARGATNDVLVDSVLRTLVLSNGMGLIFVGVGLLVLSACRFIGSRKWRWMR